MTTAPRKKSPKAPPRSSRPHDTAATMALIVDTAATLLAEKGFTGFGVTALATAAGVDKKLIYYHFGGIDEVLRQLGGRLDLWLGTPPEPVKNEAYADAINRLLAAYFGALRGNTLVQRLLAWELVEPSDVLRELEATRSQAMGAWVEQLRGTLGTAPDGVDAPAINALLLAGLHYLTLREGSVGSFAGMDIQSPEGSARICAAVNTILAGVYGKPAAARKRRPTSTP